MKKKQHSTLQQARNNPVCVVSVYLFCDLCCLFIWIHIKQQHLRQMSSTNYFFCKKKCIFAKNSCFDSQTNQSHIPTMRFFLACSSGNGSLQRSNLLTIFGMTQLFAQLIFKHFKLEFLRPSIKSPVIYIVDVWVCSNNGWVGLNFFSIPFRILLFTLSYVSFFIFMFPIHNSFNI